MKSLAFSLLLVSVFASAQQIPEDNMENSRTICLKKFDRVVWKKDFLKSANVQKDSSVYKILNKLPENPQRYVMLVDKNVRGAVPIPNVEEKIALMKPLPKNNPSIKGK